MPQLTKANRFRSLHKPGAPLLLVNAWDAGSAQAIARAGAPAIATGSWSMAASNGLADGEKISRDLVMDMLRRIAGATDLPVTVDLEAGYGSSAGDVAETLRLSIAAGAIGCNLEDSDPADASLRSIEEAAARIGAARVGADAELPGFFINARTDVFFRGPSTENDASLLPEALARAHAYAEAGADGLFAPGLSDLSLIAELAAASPIPLNIMRLGTSPSIRELAEAGVARVSHGPFPYLHAMGALEGLARQIAEE